MGCDVRVTNSASGLNKYGDSICDDELLKERKNMF